MHLLDAAQLWLEKKIQDKVVNLVPKKARIKND